MSSSNKHTLSNYRVERYVYWYGNQASLTGWVYLDLVNNYISETDCKALLEFINSKSKREKSTLLKTHLLELNHIINRKLIKLKKHNVKSI